MGSQYKENRDRSKPGIARKRNVRQTEKELK